MKRIVVGILVGAVLLIVAVVSGLYLNDAPNPTLSGLASYCVFLIMEAAGTLAILFVLASIIAALKLFQVI